MLLRRRVEWSTKNKKKSDVPQSTFSETPLTLTSRYIECVVVLCLPGYFYLFGGALKEVIKTSLFHLLRPQRFPLLRRWFPLLSLRSSLSLALAHTFCTIASGKKYAHRLLSRPEIVFQQQIGHTMCAFVALPPPLPLCLLISEGRSR